jgi:heme exporter protein A
MYDIPDPTVRVNQVLELVGLSNRARDLVRTFSRGMQQRLAIGRAVLHDPEVLLLDEPHTGLDQDACNMLDKVLRDVAIQGRTVVMTSHDFVRVQNLANRFDVLSRGKIIASAKSSEISRDGLQAFYRQALEEG